MTNDQRTRILDTGQFTTKIGYAGDPLPLKLFHTIIGINPFNEKAVYFGNVAQEKRDFLTITCPLENGKITDFKEMGELWDYAFEDLLQTDAQNHPILLTQPIFTSDDQLEKISEILFEENGIPSLSIANPS